MLTAQQTFNDNQTAYEKLVAAGQQFIAAIDAYKVATHTILETDPNRASDWHVSMVEQVVSEVSC